MKNLHRLFFQVSLRYFFLDNGRLCLTYWASPPPSLSRTTPTSTPPSPAWWTASWLWRMRKPWVTPRPPPAAKQNRFWFCLASTTTPRRRDSVGVQDVRRLKPEAGTTTEGMDRSEPSDWSEICSLKERKRKFLRIFLKKNHYIVI